MENYHICLVTQGKHGKVYFSEGYLPLQLIDTSQFRFECTKPTASKVKPKMSPKNIFK